MSHKKIENSRLWQSGTVQKKKSIVEVHKMLVGGSCSIDLEEEKVSQCKQ